MCGITGFYSPRGLHPQAAEAEVAAMTRALAHRGPDGAGTWVDGEAGIALGHRRLAILDLSDAGRQPMPSHSGRYVLTFNGEIYNHQELRRELPDTAWKSHSDTETILAAVEAWGFERALPRFSGMFALALWDRERRELCLARDRFGEKPLYYGWNGGMLFFASELKALRGNAGFRADIDRDVVTLYIRHGYVPAPCSVLHDIHKLRPGAWVRIAGGGSGPAAESHGRYWSLAEVQRRAQAAPFSGDMEEAVGQLDGLVQAAVRRQLLSDVPVGAFLSGGIDSSLVVAVMQRQVSQRVKTFTVSYGEKGYDEGPYASAVAAHLGTDHAALVVAPGDAQRLLPSLVDTYDEPFADASAIPTMLVSAFARRAVTVSLSGDGGDEIFAGYTRYLSTARSWRVMQSIPSAFRHRLPEGLQEIPVLSRKVPAIVEALRAGDALDYYRALSSQWPHPEGIVRGGEPLPSAWDGARGEFAHPIAQFMMADACCYLPDAVLCKLDRAAMRVGLETRVPLLDPAVVDFAASLPFDYKSDGVTAKRILRELLRRYVPAALTERPKMGFAVPVDEWVRGPLRPWAEDLLSEARLRREGYLEPARIRRMWLEHVEGRRNWRDPLWVVLMWQAWLERYSADLRQAARPPVPCLHSAPEEGRGGQRASLCQAPLYRGPGGQWERSFTAAAGAAAPGGAPAWDLEALLSVASLGYVLGDGTLASHVRRQPWMTVLGEDGQVRDAPIPAHGRLLVPPLRAALNLKRLLENELLAACAGRRETYLLLSGGLDSRIVAGVLAGLLESGRLTTVPTAVTWGLENSRDVVYGEAVARRLGLPWRHVPLTPEHLRRNIGLAAHHLGALVSPTHLHGMSYFEGVSADALVLAGSYGDSIGRGEYSGSSVLELRPLRPFNPSGILRPDVVAAHGRGHGQADRDRLRRRLGARPAYALLEAEHQAFYMGGLIAHAMSIITGYCSLYQAFTAPEVFGYMWSLHPAARTDDIYAMLLQELGHDLIAIPWARTNRPLLPGVAAVGLREDAERSHHRYPEWLSRDLHDYAWQWLDPQWFAATGLFDPRALAALREEVLGAGGERPFQAYPRHQLVAWLLTLRHFVEEVLVQPLAVPPPDPQAARAAADGVPLREDRSILREQLALVPAVLGPARRWRRRWLRRQALEDYPPVDPRRGGRRPGG